MTSFTKGEAEYLREAKHLGRLATIQPDGVPHVVPVGWRFDEPTGTIEVSGRNFAASRKFRNVRTNPKVAIVIDDVLPPWRPRSVMVQGEAEVVDAADSPTGQAMIRIHPTKIVSWGV